MSKIRVAVATYTNTLPFLNGIKSSPIANELELIMDFPSACANLVINDEADLGIIPIQALMDIPEYHLISDYCIGTNGAVDSVFIFSNKPIQDIRNIRLDKESKTSNGLARILLKYYWKTPVEITDSEDADAYVLIGDRTFGKKKTVPYAYDLGFYWKEFTGLPFAFAVWASNKKLPIAFEEKFNKALGDGISDMNKIIETLPTQTNFDYQKYLTQNLNFDLTPEKRQAIDKYLELYATL